MVEQADTGVLKTLAERFPGSTPGVPTFTGKGIFGDVPIYRSKYVPADTVLVACDPFRNGTSSMVMFVGVGEEAKREGRLKRLWRWIVKCFRACEI